MHWILTSLLLQQAVLISTPDAIPKDFISIESIAPSIIVDMRYFTTDNFVGEKIDGYQQPHCLLTRPAARALQKVQTELQAMGLTLRVYDCYRPQRAVDHFVRWARNLDDTRKKSVFYPDISKSRLFELGYIARRSGHSRGSTVDLTIDGLDMGTPWDFFSPLSHTTNPSLNPPQRANRLLLKTLMERHGFRHYAKEWWHFTLVNEPFAQTFFNFPVQ